MGFLRNSRFAAEATRFLLLQSLAATRSSSSSSSSGVTRFLLGAPARRAGAPSCSTAAEAAAAAAGRNTCCCSSRSHVCGLQVYRHLNLHLCWLSSCCHLTTAAAAPAAAAAAAAAEQPCGTAAVGSRQQQQTSPAAEKSPSRDTSSSCSSSSINSIKSSNGRNSSSSSSSSSSIYEDILSFPLVLPQDVYSARCPKAIAAALTAELLLLQQQLQPAGAAHLRCLSTFLLQLQQVLQQQQLLRGVSVAAFGSCVSGVWTAAADIDISLLLPGCNSRPQQQQALKAAAAVLQQIKGYYIETRYHAAIPLLHWAPRSSSIAAAAAALSLRHPKNGQLQQQQQQLQQQQQQQQLACDISVNNLLGVINTRLVGVYVHLDPRVRLLCLSAKHWASSRGINSRAAGTLSSFALTLMVIHFMQQQGLLPLLQDLAQQQQQQQVYVQGVDCRFCCDPLLLQQHLQQLYTHHTKDAAAAAAAATAAVAAAAGAVQQQQRGRGQDTTAAAAAAEQQQQQQQQQQELLQQLPGPSAGDLLLRFFRFYSQEYKGGVIAIRTVPSSSSSSSSSSNFLHVDNPFEVGKDVSNLHKHQIPKILFELKRAHRMLTQGAPFAAVCNR